MEGQEGIDALFLYATEGILVVNATGEITRVNPSAENLFGYEKGELVGKKIETLIPQRFAGRHMDHRDKYNENPHARSMGAGMELFGQKKDGSEFPVEISLSPYSSSQGKFVIAFIVDITVRKQAEDRLRNYSAELEKQVKSRTLILEEAIHELEVTKKDLNHALEKEKELNELKTRFVSMASHEFRTPLATMMTSLSLIAKYGEQQDMGNQNKHISKIKKSIHSLTDILNDLLSVSKLEEGKITINPENINLKTFISEIITEMQPLTSDGQILNQHHTGEENIVSDKKILRHILFNLVSNAIKFSPGGQSIDIFSVVEKDEFILSVADKGIGIPEEDQEHLFERFFRGHNASNIQGTGLGLNIVSRYIELLNGSITFKSEKNKGTTFIITLPK